MTEYHITMTPSGGMVKTPITSGSRESKAKSQELSHLTFDSDSLAARIAGFLFVSIASLVTLLTPPVNNLAPAIKPVYEILRSTAPSNLTEAPQRFYELSPSFGTLDQNLPSSYPPYPVQQLVYFEEKRKLLTAEQR